MRHTTRSLRSSGARTASFAEGGFFHADRRARFVPTVPRSAAHAPTPSRPLRLNTGRVRDQWHTMTRTGKSARLSGHRPEPTVELHPRDANARGIAGGAIVSIESRWGRAVLRAHLSDTVRPGEPFTPMHWTAQGLARGRINAAVNPASTRSPASPSSSTRPSKSVHGREMAWHDSRSRALMMAARTYWTRLNGAGHLHLRRGRRAAACRGACRPRSSAAASYRQPGPCSTAKPAWRAVIADWPHEAVDGDPASVPTTPAPTALAPFMAIDASRPRGSATLCYTAVTRADRAARCAPASAFVHAIEDGHRQGAPVARRGRRVDPRRHQLRLLPARDPPAAARGARQEGGVMQNFPLFLSLQDAVRWWSAAATRRRARSSCCCRRARRCR
jgi:formylmethanofuran dehydrogenase subunit D